MSETLASIGFGVLFKVRTATGPDVYTTLGQQTAVKPYGVSVDSVDATHEESDDAWREFIAGLKDGGESTSELIYVPGGATEADIFEMLGTTQHCRVSFPNGAYVDFRAHISGAEPDTPIDDKMTFAITWKVSGKVTPVAAEAPVNNVQPAISGTPQVGVELTAFPGLWAKEARTFTYQWKKAGVDIAGATGETYTPVVGDVDAALSVAVTGTNSAGSATATSALTADVVAA